MRFPSVPLPRDGLAGRLLLAAFLLIGAGCQSAGPTGSPGGRKSMFSAKQPPIRRVVCLFDQRPWLNADAAGDRDPEGIRYRVFLDTGDSKGVLREGTFHVQMYRIKREGGKEVGRDLECDWHYPTGQFDTVSAKILGEGYMLQLRWPKKDTAGNEIELVTTYEAPDGRTVRSATTRKRVPKYVS